MPVRGPAWQHPRRDGPHRIAAILITAAVGLTLFAAPADASTPQTSTRWQACTRKLDGVTTTLAKTQRSVVVVNQTSKTHARLSFYVRTDSRCSLVRKVFTKTARLGYGGTVPGTERKQGTGTTPLGTWRMTEAFGLQPEPAMWLPYHRVVKGDHWVGDNESRYYNTLRNKSQGGFRWKLPSSKINSSEYLPHYTTQYRYSLVIDFNRNPVKERYRETGIFLHVKGDGATAGCVSITEPQLLKIMAYLHSGDKITIAR